jgi:crotonobetainyl-CoA:carnitine CoA-transferase CaiB-like acyl-CoA transferase
MTEPHWLPSTPYRSSAWDRVASYRPPRLGEDTLELLDEIGFAPEEAQALQERNIIYAPSKESV